MEEQSLCDDLYSLEEQLLQPRIRKSRDDLEKLLADDFVEFGSTGRVFHKEDAVEGLLAETSVKMTLSHFRINVLSSTLAHATYISCQHSDMRYALRSSIWKLNDGVWQMCFHQGTITSTPQP